LALGEQQDRWLAVAVTDGMQLRVHTAFGPPDTAGNSPFLTKLAAERCALRGPASIITVSVVALLAADAVKMRSNTPIRLQRTKRLYRVLCGP
jgi:hypothetical protein